jgi:cation/acetate symporter
MNREGAIAGMLSGLLFTFAYIVYFKFVSPELNSAEHWWLGISPEGIGTLGMIINLVIALIVCHLTPAPPEHIRALVNNIRVPQGAGAAYHHHLVD